MASVFGLGSSTLLHMIAHPLGTRKRGSGAHQRELDSVIEHQMIPRLMLAHSRDRAVEAPAELDPIESDFADRFAGNVLKWEADRALLEVEGLLERGHTMQELFLNLLAPAARTLGILWEEDECDFVEVTMGLWRLQEVMREIASRAGPVARSVHAPGRALFSPIPGDQHGFGALMIDEVFARAGWKSEALIEPQRRELLAVISDRPFDLVGLTITNDYSSSALESLIRAIRTVSANPALRVLIGGRMINANPEIANEVGADGTAADAFAALDVAKRLVAETGLHLNPAL